MTVASFIPHLSTSVQRLPVRCQATTLATQDAQVNKTDTVPVLESNRESDLNNYSCEGFLQSMCESIGQGPLTQQEGEGIKESFAKEAIRKLRLEDERVRRG